MTEMAIDPIYPKPNLSKGLQRATVVPYLLRNADITRPNQAWSIDITYIPMKHGFLYLTAIIDWHSRCIVGWELVCFVNKKSPKSEGKFPSFVLGIPQFRKVA